MPEYENEQQAAEALYSAVLEDGNARSDQQQMHERVAEIKAEENQPTATPAEGSEGTTEASDSFTSFDPNDLPPELQGRYRDMQADYTRKTQELSDTRRQYEALDQFGGAEAAMEAVQFAQSLATDPQYALQIHGQLSEALQAAGLTPAQAQAEATKQVQDAVGYDDDEEPDSATVQELQAVKQQLGELAKWRQQQESQQYEIQLANQMAMEERDILESHSDWGEPEMEDVYALSYSVGGNLKQAAEHYEQLQKRVLDDYLSRKASVPAGASGVASTVVNAESPQKFTDLFDPELEKMVNERLAQEIAAGNNL